MGLKADTSFLRFLTIGAVGARATIDHLNDHGFEAIELERYGTSNKIWATKVKRLRLPDLICVKTGLRIEVRAKSELKVRMSDAPNNPERRWDVGLRDEDLVAFIACDSENENISASGSPVFFSVSDMRAVVDNTKLGPPKSASEGAERDREWPCTVPSQDGEILSVNEGKIVTQLSTGRKQTYQLRGKTAYFTQGQTFSGKSTIIAGIVPKLAWPNASVLPQWDPLSLLDAESPVDRYAAIKAIPYRKTNKELLEALKRRLSAESDERVSLEVAASAARLDLEEGLDNIVETIWNHERQDLRMEGVLILTEMGSANAAKELYKVASSNKFKNDELRQAATWGLGKTGTRHYDLLLSLLKDDDDLVVFHAIAAFGKDCSEKIISALVTILKNGSQRSKAAASGALRLIASETVLAELISAARTADKTSRPWLLATLGRLPSNEIRTALSGDKLLDDLEPVLTMSPFENWLATPDSAKSLNFLVLQNL